MLLAAIVWTALVYGGPGDIDTSLAGRQSLVLRVHHAFVVKEHKGSYDLVQETEVVCKYRSEPGYEERVFPIAEQQYCEVDRVKASFNGRKIDREFIIERFPPPEDEFFPSGLSLFIVLKDRPKVGDVVEYSFRKRFDNATYAPLLPIWNYGRMEEFVAEFKHPPDVQVSFEFYYPWGPVAHEVTNPAPNRTVLTVGPLDFCEPLPYFEGAAYRACMLVSLAKEGKLITPTAVPEFAAWYGSLTSLHPILGHRLDSAPMDKVRAAASDAERLTLIHDWVQENIRYIADGRYPHAILPHAPDEVLRRMYGDCKDRASLVAAMAREAGIDVWMALVSTEHEPSFTGVHPYQFNHVICAWEDGDSVVFFDPTARHSSFGGVPTYLVGQEALILNPENPRRVIIPPSGLTEPSLDIEVSGHRDSLSTAQATIYLRNDFLRRTKIVSATTDGVELQRELGGGLSDWIPGIQLSRFKVNRGDQFEVYLTATADLSQFIVSSPRQAYVPKGAFDLYDYEIFEREEDSLPIGFTYPTSARLRLHLRGAADADTVAVQVGERELCWFHTARWPDGAGGLQFEWELRRPVRNFHGAEKQALLEYFRSYDKLKADMYIISKGSW